MAPAVIYIVRHGETDANRDGILQGQLDTELNSSGFAQAQAVADALQSVPFDMAFCSDLSRAVKTAETIIRYHPTVQLNKVEALRERHAGCLQGQVYSPEMLIMHKDTLEKSKDFHQRIDHWWNTMIQKLSSLENQLHNVLIVSHGGWIQALVNTLINTKELTVAKGVRTHGRLSNVCITVIETDGGGKGTLVKFGDVSHLVTEAVEGNVDELM